MNETNQRAARIDDATPMTNRSEEMRPTTVDDAVEETARALQALVRAVTREHGSAGAAGESWRLLSLAEAAERLGRSERWIRERVRRGELAVIRLDAKLAFKVDDLITFANDHRSATGP
jgi:hypothetical protein